MIERIKVYPLYLLLAGLALWSGPAAAESIRYEFAESSRALMRVGPNQSLDILVHQIYPRYRELWPQIKQEIRQRNPHAFNRYTGELIVGKRLKLITVKRFRETDAVIRERVGKVVTLTGKVEVTDREGRRSYPRKDSAVYLGDRLNTSPDSTVLVSMVDGAEMYIKPDSSVRISRYTMKSGFEKGSTSIIDLIKGGLRKITGSIGANPLSVYRFHTGVMTIGVRGTDYVVKLCPENDCAQSAGRNDSDVRLHVVVLDGMITLEDPEGVNGEMVMGQYAVADYDKVAIVTEAKPVKGLMTTDENVLFDVLTPPPPPAPTPEGDSEDKSAIWPWLIGGALLFGIPL